MSRVKLEFGAHVILSRIGTGFSVVNADSNSSVCHVGWSVAGTTVERTPRVSDRFVGVVLFNRRLTIAGKKMGEKNPRKHISAENQKSHTIITISLTKATSPIKCAQLVVVMPLCECKLR
jgi:sucrose-6-phosphate hydrolase SacC (GH32 family)